MSNVFSRPLFKNEFIRRYAEGGIVSTVAGPEEPMAPAPAEADPMQVLSEMALQVDATEKNLDSAESIDEILTSFAGSPKTADQARMELAEVVGRNDAMSTPESVLALVQPTMAIMAMTKQMSPPGGISELPVGGNEQADFEDEMDLLEDDMEDDDSFSEPESLAGGVGAMTPESPLPKFQAGQEVNMQAIMNKYASMRNQIPAGYGADPTSAWMALAQLGAGMAQGTSFAEGLSKGTQMAGPYMAQGAQNVREERSALSKFVAEEAARQEAQKAREAELAEGRTFETQQLDKQIAAQLALETKRTENDMAIERLKFELSPDKLTDTQFLLNDLEKKRALLSGMSKDDPFYTTIQQQIKDRETILFGGTEEKDVRTGEMKNAARLAELDALIAEDPTNATYIGERDYLKSLVEKPENKTKLQSRNVVIWDETAPNGFTTAVANFDSTTGTSFITNEDGTQRVLKPNEFIEGTADNVVNVTPDSVGNTIVTIKQGPRAGQSYLSEFTTSNGEKIQYGNPEGVGVDPNNPYAEKVDAPTVPRQFLNAQTRDDMATKLSGIEQSIRSVDSLLKTGLKTGPGATVEGWLTKMAALTPDEIAQQMEFLKTEQGAAQWALVQREIVRARVLSPRFAVTEQEAVRQFETQAGPQEFFTNPKAAAVRLGEMLRTMKNDYEYLRGTLTNSPYRQMAPPTLGTPDDPFNMSDEKDYEYFKYLSSDPKTASSLKDTVLFFPNFPSDLSGLEEKFQKTNGIRGVGYYITVDQLAGAK